MLWTMLLFSLFLPVTPPPPHTHTPLLLPVRISQRCTQPGSHHHLPLAVPSVSPARGEVCIHPGPNPRARRPGWDGRGVPLPAEVHTDPSPNPPAASPQPWAVCRARLSRRSGSLCRAPTAFSLGGSQLCRALSCHLQGPALHESPTASLPPGRTGGWEDS